MVVALGAVEADTEKGASHPRRQAFRVRHILGWIDGDCNEIGGRFVRPESLVADQLADDFVIGPILEKLIAQPRHESPPPIDKERPVLSTDIGPRQPLREIIGKAAILEQVGQPTVQAAYATRLEAADLLQ